MVLLWRSQELMEYRFDWRYMVRGLTIDKQRGNVLKVDRHKYVKIAYHGFRQLPRDQRLSIYANSDVRIHYTPLLKLLNPSRFILPSEYSIRT